MTKDEFKVWLQGKFDEEEYEGEDKGDVWRDLESEGTLQEIGVKVGVGHTSHVFLFKCSDGFLGSTFETGMEQETIWFFTDGDASSNLQEATVEDVNNSIRWVKDALKTLTDLLD